MLNNLKGWLYRVEQEGTNPVLERVQAIAELHAGQPRGQGKAQVHSRSTSPLGGR